MQPITNISLILFVWFIASTGLYGQLSFTKNSIPLGTQPAKCAASGDIDNDGDMDIITGYRNNAYYDTNH